ncbi:BCLAF1 and THRAP3 family member 3 [Rhinophrynus dorsalis]
MIKSRSRSPRWKNRPPIYRSPEHHRQRHFEDHYNDDGFQQDPRRPIHWEEVRHRQNDLRTEPYNRFNKPYEQDSYSINLRKSPVKTFSREKRNYSPERHEESNRRFPPRYPEKPPYRDRDQDYYHHRNRGRAKHDDPNGFRLGRREDSVREPPHVDNDWEWHENESHWNQQRHTIESLPPPRRASEEFVGRTSFHKRYPEDHDFREHGPPPKRARENERPDFRQPQRNSSWKADNKFRPLHSKDWSKETVHSNPSPIVHQTNSEEFTNIEYDYSPRSPTYAVKEQTLSDNRSQKHSWQEERTSNHTKGSQRSKPSDSRIRESVKYIDNQNPDSSAKCSSKTDNSKHNHPNKNNIKLRPPSLMEKSTDNNEPQKEPTCNNWRDKSPRKSDAKEELKITPAMECITVNLALEKPVDKYRDGRNPSERQMSQDLVSIGRKETYRPVCNHLEASTPSKMEFTQEIITIIHELKASHFKSADITLHERFSKLQSESNKEDANLSNAAPLTNQEIHRRIDISLEDLHSKSLNRTETQPVSKRVIEDPNDLRHDIERRRKQRLLIKENGDTDVNFNERGASANYSIPQINETGYFQKSTRPIRPPFRKPPERQPGSYYREKNNQFYSSESHYENADEMRRPYKGRGNAATGI